MPDLGLIPAEITDVGTFLVLGSCSVVLVSLAKAGFGGSIGVLSVPIMIYACGGEAMLANAIMLPLLIACDYFALVSWWWEWDRRTVVLLLPGLLIGVGLGWAGLWWIRRLGAGGQTDLANAALMFAIGAIALGFVVLQGVRSLRTRPLRFRPVLWEGTCVGTAAGLTSTLAHAAGPIVTMYMLPQQLPKGRYVASTVLYYWIGNQVKLVPYFALGMIHTRSLGASLLLLPAVVVGVAAGIFLHRRVGQRQFNGVIYTLLALAGVHLIVKGAQVLWSFG